MAMSYSDYLYLNQLLSLQQPRSPQPAHDEWLFITIHQSYELWFKQVLLELEAVNGHFSAGRVQISADGLNRVLTIWKSLVSQADILETMTPTSFNAFREYLGSASGLQSCQFREIEFLLGAKSDKVLQRFAEGGAERDRLSRRYMSATLYDGFLGLLNRCGYTVPRAVLERDVTQPLAELPDVQDVLIRVYRDESPLIQLCERLVDLDEGIQEWRYRHIKFVERTIGIKTGTGGTRGLEYLRATLFQPLFPDLWALRNML